MGQLYRSQGFGPSDIYFSTDSTSSRNRPLSASRNLVLRGRIFKRAPLTDDSADPAYVAAPELGPGAFKATWTSGNTPISKNATQLARIGDKPELLYGPTPAEKDGKKRQPALRAQLSMLGSGVFCKKSEDAAVLLAMMQHSLSAVGVMDPLGPELQDL